MRDKSISWMQDSNLPAWSKAALLEKRTLLINKKVTIGSLSFYSDHNKPIGKKDGVILVVWVFRVVFIDRTMLNRNVSFSNQLNKPIPG